MQFFRLRKINRNKSSYDMLFVVRRLQELGRARKIPLYMCFIDLQKAYDSVDQELLRLVLARFGVPEKMSTSSASSMKACELACVRMMVSARSGLTSLRGCGKDVCCHRFFPMLSSLPLHTPW